MSDGDATTRQAGMTEFKAAIQSAAVIRIKSLIKEMGTTNCLVATGKPNQWPARRRWNHGGAGTDINFEQTVSSRASDDIFTDGLGTATLYDCDLEIAVQDLNCSVRSLPAESAAVGIIWAE